MGRPRKAKQGISLTLDALKRVVLSAFASDLQLSAQLVLKGGSAIDLAHGLTHRSSIDIDYSIEGDFSEQQLSGMAKRLQDLLSRAFAPMGLRVFDLRFEPRPEVLSDDLAEFWGGYSIAFKLIDASGPNADGPLDAMQRSALVTGPSQRRTFLIDVSRFECCAEREEVTIEGRQVLVYSPRLIVCEKLRAICQQMPEYLQAIRKGHASSRARDFFDIHELTTRFTVVFESQEFAVLCARVFGAKRVPVDLLWRINETREFHRSDFASVAATVPPGTILLGYDDYFDAVAERVNRLKAFWDKQPPA